MGGLSKWLRFQNGCALAVVLYGWANLKLLYGTFIGLILWDLLVISTLVKIIAFYITSFNMFNETINSMIISATSGHSFMITNSILQDLDIFAIRT